MIIKQNIIVEKLFFQEDISTLNWAQNNTIENAIQLVERRNELINFGWSLDTVDDFIAIANPWRVHKSVLSEEETNIGRKIIALGSFWQTSMEQEFGLDGSLKVTQLYMQIDSDQIDNNGKDAVYSYPPIDTIFYPENGKKLKESLEYDPSQVSDIYADCKA